MKTSETIDQAAEVIEDYGWTTEKMGKYHIGFCAIGAIIEVASKHDYSLVETAKAYVAKEAGLYSSNDIGYWNDKQKKRRLFFRKLRGKRAVLKTMRKAAERARRDEALGVLATNDPHTYRIAA